MLVLKQRKGLLSEATVWFAEQKYTGADIVHYKSCSFPITQMCTGEITLLTKLQQTDEELINMCELNCRNDIRKVMKEGSTTCFLYGNNIDDKTIDEFSSFYDQFNEEKNWGEVDVLRMSQNMKEYRKKNSLIISYACVEGEKCAYHVYITDGKKARLLHSCLLYSQNENKEVQKKVRMTNRFLHYNDLRKIRDMGYQWCDWGGIGMNPELYNIYMLKKSFGGKYTIVYNGTDYRNPIIKWLYWYYIYFTT